MPVRKVCILAALAGGLACDDTRIQAVGAPGDVFRTGAGCALEDLQAAGAMTCLTPAQLGFEQLADEGLLEIDEGNLSAKRVSCRRSYCGAGALVLHADYRWRVGTTPTSGEKLGELRYRLPAPTDLYGKSLTYALYLDGPDTPVNAYVAVVDTKGLFHMVDDGPVLLFRRWTQRGGAILTSNLKINLPDGATSLVAREILIAVYLATDVRTGDRERWAADFYVDQIGWN
jgi:hypothetical protein